ncbi:MAG: hypothetical protein V7750_07565 [Sneathiella sp.]
MTGELVWQSADLCAEDPIATSSLIWEHGPNVLPIVSQSLDDLIAVQEVVKYLNNFPSNLNLGN